MVPDFPTRFREAVGNGATLVEASSTEESALAFARSVVASLSEAPKWLDCRFLYDAEGSRLFEEITEQPEYYPTRTEESILARCAAEIRRITGPRTLVELGSGYSVKTEHLLEAYRVGPGVDGDGLDADLDGAARVLYVPVDVSEAALRAASRSISERFSGIQMTGINGPYRSAFEVFEQLSPQMVVFLGSTIGNLNPEESAAFWRNVTAHLPVGDFFLLGADLEKDPEVLEAAYNDAAGVTARFTKNYFVRMNRELGAGIDLEQVEHEAVWNPELRRMEIYARFLTAQRIHVRPLDRTFRIDAGERILVEISRKFRLPELEADLESHGFRVRRTFTDDRDWFAVLLLERAAATAPGGGAESSSDPE